MKRLLVALVLCLVFSPAAQAGKVWVTSTWHGDDLVPTLKGPEETGTGVGACEYVPDSNFGVIVSARKNMRLSLELVETDQNTGIEKIEILISADFDSATKLVTSVRPDFEVSEGTSWTVAWVLSRIKGKGHVIDASEVTSGTCPP